MQMQMFSPNQPRIPQNRIQTVSKPLPLPLQTPMFKMSFAKTGGGCGCGK